MNYYFRPVDWNAFTWIGVILWFAVAVYCNVSWPIDRTAKLQEFKNFRAETEKRYPELAKTLPKNMPFHFRSGVPLTYVVRDLNTTTFWSFPALLVNVLLYLASTLSLVIISQTYLRRYTVRALLVTTTIIAGLMAIDQSGAQLIVRFLYHDTAYRILFVTPVAISLLLLMSYLYRKRVKAEPSDAHEGLDQPLFRCIESYPRPR